MRVAVISDTDDHLATVHEIVSLLNRAGVERVDLVRLEAHVLLF